MRKIKHKRWYIVDLRKRSRKGSYFLIKAEFQTKEKAKKAIKLNFPGREIFFDTVTGKEAKSYEMLFRKHGNFKQHITRIYEYPPELQTTQNKKSFRTKYRRWKRDYKKELKHIWASNRV